MLHKITQTLHQCKQNAIAQYQQKHQPNVFFQQYSQALDQALQQLWQHFFTEHPNLALLAIGGFGRQEMYPYSDIDLAIVAHQSLNHDEQDRISQFVQALWDMQLHASVKSGSVTELCESAKNDLTADTAFLEARFLVGNAQIAQYFVEQSQLQRDLSTFIEGKLLEMQQRHDKQQGTVLEPNVKCCVGGLRDIHTMIWLAKVQGIQADIQTLIHQRILTRTEADKLLHSHQELAKIRMALHLTTHREEDKLIFDLQRKIAEELHADGNHIRQQSEQLMHQFYRATKTVKQLNGIILPMLRGRVYSPLPRVVHQINQDYYQVGNQIAAFNKKLFEEQPEHIFIMMEILQTRSDLNSIAPKTLRAWWTAVQHMDKRFYQNPNNRQRFLRFFQHGTGLTHIMRLLNLYGVLAHYLPTWEKIVGLLQHDLFHIYPVDDHILMVLRNMRRLAMDQHLHELPFASEIMQDYDKKEILYLAALFHDIAKGRGGDHAIEGIADAEQFAQDHFIDGKNGADGKLLAWLVEHHLLMSLTAQKEDIHNPEVVQRFCEKVQTKERLHALYLLTVADIRGTNPKIWNSWKANLLKTLFHFAERHLAGENNSTSLLSNRRQHLAAQHLTANGHDAKQQRKLWQALGDAYFVQHNTDIIIWHITHLIHQPEKAQCAIHPHHENRILQVMVYLPNAPKIFARLCRIFSQHQLDIVAARAFITEHDYVLDTFAVQFPEHCTENDQMALHQQLYASLNQFIQGQAPTPIKHKSKPSRRVRCLPIVPTIQLIEEEQNHWFTLNIVTVNRPYLLADIADIFNAHNISLRYAKINTMDERVEDHFLLYSPELNSAQAKVALQQALLDELSIE